MMKIITYKLRRGLLSGSSRIGISWKDLGLIDLRKLLEIYLVEEEEIEEESAIELSNTLVPCDTARFIGRFKIVKEYLDKCLNWAKRLTIEDLKGKGLLIEFNKIKFLPPVPRPPKVLGIGLNFDEYREMLKYPKPDVPLFFFKPTNTLIGHEEYIHIPKGRRWKGTSSNCLFHEYEMAIVISKRCKNVDRREAYEHVFGVTIFNDITAHDIEMVKPGHVLYQQRAKAFDTFSPVGPWIVTMDELSKSNIDLHNLRILRRRNGVVEGESNTKNMIFKIPEIIEFLTEIMTLEPGDIISLGSPPAGPPDGLKPGDIIETEIENIGVLRNKVV